MWESTGMRLCKQSHQLCQHPSPPSSFVITYGSIQDAIVGGIRDMILNGHLKPGDRLRQDEDAGALIRETITGAN